MVGLDLVSPAHQAPVVPMRFANRRGRMTLPEFIADEPTTPQNDPPPTTPSEIDIIIQLLEDLENQIDHPAAPG